MNAPPRFYCKRKLLMVRQNLLVIGLILVSLTGCQMSTHVRHHSFRPPGMFGVGCGSCGEDCGDCCQCGRQSPGRFWGKRRTAQLFHGDTYGQAGECGSVSAGWGCCGSCDGAPFMNSGCMAYPVPLPATVSHSCGCGEQHSAQPYSPQPYEPQSMNAPTLVPSAPLEFKPPTTFDATGDSSANDSTVPEGQVPVPPGDEPIESSETRVPEAAPPVPQDVEPATGGAPAAATPADPVSWEIPAEKPLSEVQLP